MPTEYKYDVIKNVKEQFDIVKKLYHRNDVSTLYLAGDSGREGILIQYRVREAAGLNPNIQEKVVWLDSQTEEEIKRGIREAKPTAYYQSLIDAGELRSIEDYALGINLSRAFTVKYARALNHLTGTKKYISINIGRVMTCVLGMVVFREREILNFKVTDFYKPTCLIGDLPIQCNWKAIPGSGYYGDPKLYSDIGFKERNDANEMISKLPENVVVENTEFKESKKKAPAMYNLAELQSECSKKLKISPDKTLEIAQSLYEKKLTTYPRTDARVLTTAMAKEVEKNITGLKNSEYDTFINLILSQGLYRNIALEKKYVDDSKVTDHYAIIPTGLTSGIEKLTELESQVFDMIVKRFLAIFLPPIVYKQGKITVKANNETFEATGKIITAPGYSILYEQDENKDCDKMHEMENLKKGQSISASYEIQKGETKPPSRYTSGSLILAMENAGNLIEDEELREQIKSCGIGTSATRAETIKKLCDLSYIKLNKKTQIITPDILGEHVCALVEEISPSLLNPKMTASWEKGLDMIVKKQITKENYQEKIYDYIKKEIKAIKETTSQRYNPEIGKVEKKELTTLCPNCQKPIIAWAKAYGCSSYKSKTDKGCGFAVFKNIAGHMVTEEELETLVQGKTLENLSFTSSKGKPFTANLLLEKTEEGYKTKLDFGEEEREKEETTITCPKCKKNLYKDKYYYRCSCGFKIGHTIASRSLSEEEAKVLIKEKEIGPLDGFVSKKNKPFSAKLVLKKKGIEFKFD